MPAVSKLPPVMLPAVTFPLTFRVDNTLPVKLRPAAFKLLPVIFPVALTTPVVNKLPPLMLAVADTMPAVSKLPPVMLPAVNKLPPMTLAVALTTPVVNKLPPRTFPVAETSPETNAPLGVITTTLPVPPIVKVTFPLVP